MGRKFSRQDAIKLRAAWKRLDLALCEITEIAMEIDDDEENPVNSALGKIACELQFMSADDIEKACETACRSQGVKLI